MLAPSVHPLLWLFGCVLFRGEMLCLRPREGEAVLGGGIWGARLHGGGTKGKWPDVCTCSTCHWKAQRLNSGVAEVRLLGKMWPYQVYRVYLTALE